MVSDVMGQCQQWELQCSVYFYKGAHEYPVLDRRPGSNDLELDFRWVCAVSCARNLIPPLMTIDIWPWSRRWTCDLEAVPWWCSNPTVDNIFGNIHLFRVPRSLTDSVQMKSSITFIQGNSCIEWEKDNFKKGCEVKRLKECALALILSLSKS